MSRPAVPQRDAARAVLECRAEASATLAIEEIERPGIERDGDALEAEPGDDLERIAQAVGSEAVGVVAEAHVRWDCTCAGAPWPAR